ncbi:MAG: hypothetical protein IT479_14140 [Xanthomonadales bacterium]|nr:hypothetical protein [Xanthomonadales bacterium]
MQFIRIPPVPVEHRMPEPPIAGHKKAAAARADGGLDSPPDTQGSLHETGQQIRFLSLGWSTRTF